MNIDYLLMSIDTMKPYQTVSLNIGWLIHEIEDVGFTDVQSDGMLVYSSGMITINHGGIAEGVSFETVQNRWNYTATIVEPADELSVLLCVSRFLLCSVAYSFFIFIL